MHPDFKTLVEFIAAIGSFLLVTVTFLLALITFLYFLATKKMASTMGREFDLRTKPRLNISLLQGELGKDVFYRFRCQIENKGYYSVELEKYRICALHDLRGVKPEFYNTERSMRVFIDAGESYLMDDLHDFEGILKHVQPGNYAKVIMHYIFTFRDCMGREFKETREIWGGYFGPIDSSELIRSRPGPRGYRLG